MLRVVDGWLHDHPDDYFDDLLFRADATPLGRRVDVVLHLLRNRRTGINTYSPLSITYAVIHRIAHRTIWIATGIANMRDDARAFCGRPRAGHPLRSRRAHSRRRTGRKEMFWHVRLSNGRLGSPVVHQIQIC